MYGSLSLWVCVSACMRACLSGDVCVSTLGSNPVPGRLQASQACPCVPLPAPCACWSTWPLHHVPGSPLPLFHCPSSDCQSWKGQKAHHGLSFHILHTFVCVEGYPVTSCERDSLPGGKWTRLCGWVASISFPTRVCLRPLLYWQSQGVSSQCVSVLY